MTIDADRKKPDATATAVDEKPSAADVVEATVVEAVGPVIQDLPKPKQREIVTKIEESLTAIVATGLQGPKLDPETARLLAATVEKDNENKFKYLSQKEQHEVDLKKGELDFDRECHRDHIRIIKPVILSSVVVVAISIGAGFWFITKGQEAIGIGILSSIASATFGFLGGLGVANLFKGSDRQRS